MYFILWIEFTSQGCHLLLSQKFRSLEMLHTPILDIKAKQKQKTFPVRFHTSLMAIVDVFRRFSPSTLMEGIVAHRAILTNSTKSSCYLQSFLVPEVWPVSSSLPILILSHMHAYTITYRKLHICRVCLHDARTSIWMRKSALKHGCRPSSRHGDDWSKASLFTYGLPTKTPNHLSLHLTYHFYPLLIDNQKIIPLSFTSNSQEQK